MSSNRFCETCEESYFEEHEECPLCVARRPNRERVGALIEWLSRRPSEVVFQESEHGPRATVKLLEYAISAQGPSVLYALEMVRFLYEHDAPDLADRVSFVGAMKERYGEDAGLAKFTDRAMAFLPKTEEP